MKYIILIAVVFGYCTPTIAQIRVINSFHLVDLDPEQNCRETRIVDRISHNSSSANHDFTGFSYHPNGKVYAIAPDTSLEFSYLYEWNTTTDTTYVVKQIHESTLTGIHSSYNGKIYLAGRKLFVFDPSNNQVEEMGTLPKSCSGDIVTYNNDLYYNGDNSIYKIDTENVENSEVVFEFPDSIPLVSDLVNMVNSCADNHYYLLTTSIFQVDGEFVSTNHQSIYEYDFSNNNLTLLCDRIPSDMSGGSSPLEYFSSQCNFLLDLDLNNSSQLLAQDYQLDTFCVTQLPIADEDVEIHADAPIDSILIEIASSPQAPAEEQLTISSAADLNVLTDRRSLTLVATPTATFEAYENAIRNIRYEITGDNINGGERQIYLTAYSAGRESDLATAFLRINTTEPPSAGIDTDTTFCLNNVSYELNDLLVGEATEDGRWSPNNTFYPDLFTPQIDPMRTFTYVTGGENGCAADTATLQVETLPAPQTGYPINQGIGLQYCTGTEFPTTTTNIDTSFVESFMWEDGFPELNRTINQADFGDGPFLTLSLTAPNGCKNLFGYVNYETDTFFDQEFFYGCEGSEVVFADEIFVQDTTFRDTISGGVNCDTIHEVEIRFTPQLEREITATICAGEVYQIDDQIFTASGNYQTSANNPFGCDMLINLNLTVIDQPLLSDLQISPADCDDSLRTITAIGDWENIEWSTGETTASIEVSTTATYVVTVTNANQCSVTDSIFVEIINSESIELDTQIVHNRCPDGNEGFLVIEPSGNFPFTIEWSDDETGSFRGALEAGTYEATITDANDCSIIFRDTILAPDPFQVSGEITNATNGNTNNGAIEITSVTGGTPPYDLSWNNSMTGASLTNLAIGDYILTVTDSLNCQFRTGFAVSVNVATNELPDVEQLVRIHPNPTTGLVQMKFLNPQFDFQTVQLFNIVGQSVLERNLMKKNTETLDITHLPAGVYLLQFNSEMGSVTTRLVKQ